MDFISLLEHVEIVGSNVTWVKESYIDQKYCGTKIIVGHSSRCKDVLLFSCITGMHVLM